MVLPALSKEPGPKNKMNPENMEAAQDAFDDALSGMETERLKEILEERGYKVEKIREVEE